MRTVISIFREIKKQNIKLENLFKYEVKDLVQEMAKNDLLKKLLLEYYGANEFRQLCTKFNIQAQNNSTHTTYSEKILDELFPFIYIKKIDGKWQLTERFYHIALNVLSAGYGFSWNNDKHPKLLDAGLRKYFTSKQLELIELLLEDGGIQRQVQKYLETSNSLTDFSKVVEQFDQDRQKLIKYYLEKIALGKYVECFAIDENLLNRIAGSGLTLSHEHPICDDETLSQSKEIFFKKYFLPDNEMLREGYFNYLKHCCKFNLVKSLAAFLSAQEYLSSIELDELLQLAHSHKKADPSIWPIMKNHVIQGNHFKKDKDDHTVVHVLAQKGVVDVLSSLLESHTRISLDQKNKSGQTPLHLAAIHNRQNAVDKLVASGGSVNVIDDRGWTPLMYAARNGATEVVESLLRSKKCKVNLHNGQASALMLAVEGGHQSIVEKLLAAGADPYFRPADSQQALEHLSSNDAISHTIQKHREKISGTNNEHTAVLASYIATGNLEKDATKPATINSTNSDGKTALHLALERSDFENVQQLISAGALLNTPDQHGRTPYTIIENKIAMTSTAITPLAQFCQNDLAELQKVMSSQNDSAASNQGFNSQEVQKLKEKINGIGKDSNFQTMTFTQDELNILKKLSAKNHELRVKLLDEVNSYIQIKTKLVAQGACEIDVDNKPYQHDKSTTSTQTKIPEIQNASSQTAATGFFSRNANIANFDNIYARLKKIDNALQRDPNLTISIEEFALMRDLAKCQLPENASDDLMAQYNKAKSIYESLRRKGYAVDSNPIFVKNFVETRHREKRTLTFFQSLKALWANFSNKFKKNNTT